MPYDQPTETSRIYVHCAATMLVLGGPLPNFKQICCGFCLSQNIAMSETVFVNRYLKLGCITLSGLLKNIDKVMHLELFYFV